MCECSAQIVFPAVENTRSLGVERPVHMKMKRLMSDRQGYIVCMFPHQAAGSLDVAMGAISLCICNSHPPSFLTKWSHTLERLLPPRSIMANSSPYTVSYHVLLPSHKKQMSLCSPRGAEYVWLGCREKRENIQLWTGAAAHAHLPETSASGGGTFIRNRLTELNFFLNDIVGTGWNRF